jgi:cholesterol transport system auxiliary component
MKIILKKICMIALLAATGLLSACGTYKGAPQVVFDLGTAPKLPAMTMAMPSVLVADPNVAPWLDSFEMFYRLSYANDHQLRPYTNSRWSMPPVQLFTERLRASIAAAGGQVLSPTENASNVPLMLRLDGDDFSQEFDSAAHSTGNITIRASLFSQRILIAQKTFSVHADASSNDAAGGARALSNGSDMLIADMLHWLAEASTRK